MISAPDNPTSILFIDDDEDDYLITKRVLARIPDSKFSLDWCSSFEEAVELIDQRSHDIYLVDYQLGERTGFELLKIAEPEKRQEPFILLTGANDRRIEKQAVKLGASDYLLKGSFDAELLSRSLNYALGRKQAEAQRFQHLIELNQAKDEFISIASHQLRTPATGVKQYVGMLLEGMFGELTEPQKELLMKAYESNERQLKIVSDLLKVARVDAGKVVLKKAEADIGVLLKDIVGEQRAIAKRRGQVINLALDEGDVSAWVDRDAIRMVFENLIDNASKYSENGTEIQVQMKVKSAVIVVRIADKGVGISEADLVKLFEKFSRIHNPLSTHAGGSGLGLYWAKKIVDLHNGTIEVASKKSEGTEFTVTLPRSVT